MMYIYLEDQLVFILLSFVCGMFLSFVYDIFRILRSLRGNVYFKGSLSNNFFSELNFFDGYNAIRKKLLLLNEKSKASFLLFFFEDIIFSFITVICILALIYGANYGIPRAFSVVAVILGFLAFRFTFGNVALRLIEYFLYFFGLVLYFLLFPVYFLLRKILKMIYKCYRLLYNRMRRRIIVRLSRKELKSIEKFMVGYLKKLKVTN